jgi:signal transduction histidine kinase
VRTDLAAAVYAAVEGLTLKAKERDIAIVVSVPQSPSLVMGDRAKLSQVVINLLDNAVKFSRDGGTVNVSITENGPCWRLTVADKGVGISPQVLPQLFERFVQEDGSLSRNYDGVGLGLVIVKKIAEAHGGRVWIESQLGAGTKVFVELPACQEPDKLTTVNLRKEKAHA